MIGNNTQMKLVLQDWKNNCKKICKLKIQKMNNDEMDRLVDNLQRFTKEAESKDQALQREECFREYCIYISNSKSNFGKADQKLLEALVKENMSAEHFYKLYKPHTSRIASFKLFEQLEKGQRLILLCNLEEYARHFIGKEQKYIFVCYEQLKKEDEWIRMRQKSKEEYGQKTESADPQAPSRIQLGKDEVSDQVSFIIRAFYQIANLLTKQKRQTQPKLNQTSSQDEQAKSLKDHQP